LGGKGRTENRGRIAKTGKDLLGAAGGTPRVLEEQDEIAVRVVGVLGLRRSGRGGQGCYSDSADREDFADSFHGFVRVYGFKFYNLELPRCSDEVLR
jgi:hypothetical protein